MEPNDQKPQTEEPADLEKHLNDVVAPEPLPPSAPTAAPPVAAKAKRKFPKWVWGVVALVVIAAAAGAYMLARKPAKTVQPTKTVQSTAPTTSTPKQASFQVYVKPIAGLNLRSAKDSTVASNILVVMPFDAAITVDDDSDSTWDHGTYSGQTGYFSKSLVVKNEADVTADWKTFTDSTFSYGFKYPSDWKVANEDADGELTTRVTDAQGKNRVTVYSTYGRGCSGDGGPITSPRTSTFTAGGQSVEALEFTCGGTKTSDFYFYVDVANKQDIEVNAYIDAYEAVSRQILKTATGFTKVYKK